MSVESVDIDAYTWLKQNAKSCERIRNCYIRMTDEERRIAHSVDCVISILALRLNSDHHLTPILCDNGRIDIIGCIIGCHHVEINGVLYPAEDFDLYEGFPLPIWQMKYAVINFRGIYGTKNHPDVVKFGVISIMNDELRNKRISFMKEPYASSDGGLISCKPPAEEQADDEGKNFLELL